MRNEVEERILGWTDDVELNKYLVYAILEHLVVKLVPEMRNKTTSELLAERGVVSVGEWEGEDVGGEKEGDQLNGER